MAGLTACTSEDDHTSTAPGPPPPHLIDVTPASGGALDTPVAPPCSEADPPVVAEVSRRQTISGRIVAVREVEDELGRPTLLEMGEPGGTVPFAIALSDAALAQFPVPVEEAYIGRTVCVSGVVQELYGIPVIFASGPSDLTVLDGP
jgi:hypothetical protein